MKSNSEEGIENSERNSLSERQSRLAQPASLARSKAKGKVRIKPFDEGDEEYRVVRPPVRFGAKLNESCTVKLTVRPDNPSRLDVINTTMATS